jgi:ADP-ribose pyrophosphatase
MPIVRDVSGGAGGRDPGVEVSPSAAPTPSGNVAPDGDADLRERLLDRRVLHRGRYLTFQIDQVERADGTRATRDVCAHPGAVAIVALDAVGRVALVRQWRHPAGRSLLEIPAGTLEVDDATGAVEDHSLAAPRELEEETGLRAGSWRLLTRFWTAPGFTSELMYLYLATDLRSAQAEADRREPDEDERLHRILLPLSEAVAAVERGEIQDAKSVIGLLWVARLGQSGGT